ncbi:MAG: hypothetical protein C4536_02435 [Actinobacteria bacterium]|jgi:hypothetical protein|nr:MAG: hypothetical protein C4536_02435 [Actinomycetota bacterium]
MKELKACPECGVPDEVSQSTRWESNGTIAGLRTPGQRSLYFEVAGINGLFENIEKQVGQSVNRIIIEGKRKNTLEYLEDYFSGVMAAMVRSLGRRRIYMAIARLGAVAGYGNFEILEIKRGEHVRVYGRNIYSIPLLKGDLMAAFNFTERLPASVTMQEKEDGYLMKIEPGEKPDEDLSSRLEPVLSHPKPGDIHYDTCALCGAPAELKNWLFDLGEGTITNGTTGRRLASLGIDQVDAVLRELQAELGEDFENIILQAQRDYVKDVLGAEEMGGGKPYLRRFFALRGMGNLVSYELGDDRLRAVVENARPPLMVAGILYGIFELLTERAGEIDYSLRDGGDLEVEVAAIP